MVSLTPQETYAPWHSIGLWPHLELKLDGRDPFELPTAPARCKTRGHPRLLPQGAQELRQTGQQPEISLISSGVEKCASPVPPQSSHEPSAHMSAQPERDRARGLARARIGRHPR